MLHQIYIFDLPVEDLSNSSYKKSIVDMYMILVQQATLDKSVYSGQAVLLRLECAR